MASEPTGQRLEAWESDGMTSPTPRKRPSPLRIVAFVALLIAVVICASFAFAAVN